jgi:hypothetical protein
MTMQKPGIARRHFLKVLPAALLVPTTSSANAAAVGILQPSMRFVWYGGSATLAGDRSQIEPDRNGGWINRQTGERYGDVPATGAGGTAFNAVDVMNIANGTIILYQTSYLHNPDAGGEVTFNPSNGIVGNMNGVADYWLAPQYLAGLAEQMAPASRIIRMPYQTAGAAFNAIAIQSNSGAGWSHYVYDLGTGIMLSFGSTTQGQSVLTRGPGDVIMPGEGNTMVAFSRFMGMRSTSLPGPGEVFPREFSSARQIIYQGYRSTYLPGAQPYQFPVQLRYDLAGSAGAYMLLRITLSDEMTPRDQIALPGIIGSLWMNPATLAQLSSSAVLDEDPIMRVQTLSLGHNGNLAQVAVRSGLEQDSFAYDLHSGMLMQMDIRTQVAVATSAITLQFASMQ